MHSILTLTSKGEDDSLKTLCKISDNVDGSLNQVSVLEFCLSDLDIDGDVNLEGQKVEHAKQGYNIIDSLTYKVHGEESLNSIADNFRDLLNNAQGLSGDALIAAVEFIEKANEAWETGEDDIEIHSVLLEEVE